MNYCEYNDLPLEIKEQLKKANIYYDASYGNYEELNGNKVWYLYNETFIQVVSIHIIKKVFVNARLLSEPFVLSDNNFSENELGDFLNEVLTILKNRLKVDWLESTPAGALFKAYPIKSKRIRWGNYVVDMHDKSIDDVFNGFDSKHRNMVRRGERSEITVKFGGEELLDDYLALDAQTWSRSDKEIDNAELYRRCIKALGDNSIVGIAYNAEGVAQCGLLGFYNEEMFYYMYGASANRPDPGSTHYLQFQTMKLMIERGVKAYNFVGCRINVDKDSKYERIQHFKKGFGGELVECYMFKAVLNNVRFKLFKFLYSLKGKTFPVDAIDDEFDKWLDIN